MHNISELRNRIREVVEECKLCNEDYMFQKALQDIPYEHSMYTKRVRQKSLKKALASEIRLLPKRYVHTRFPGGFDFQEAEARFERSYKPRTRRGSLSLSSSKSKSPRTLYMESKHI